MAELTTDDVEQFTGGRLLAADPEVERMLDTALAVARRECGWNVSPVARVTLLLDGPGSRILSVPSRKIVDLVSVTENGTSLNIADLTWSAGGPPGLMERPAAIRKRNRGWWSEDYQSVEVVMDSGYTEEEAPDWRQAVLSMVDQMASLSSSGRGDSDLVSKRVDDVTYTYGNPYAGMAQQAVFGMGSIFDDYRLPRLEFM